MARVVWLNCECCGGVHKLFLTRLSAALSLLVNPSNHDVQRKISGRSVLLLVDMKVVRKRFVGSVIGSPSQPSINRLMKSLEVVEEADKSAIIRIGERFFRVKGRVAASDEIIAFLEAHGEQVLEWLPKIVFLKCLSKAGWKSVIEAYSRLICKSTRLNKN